MKLNELWKTGTPEQCADALFIHYQENWYHLCGLDSQTEFLKMKFEEYQEKQKLYSDKPDGWQHKFYTQFLRHRD